MTSSDARVERDQSVDVARGIAIVAIVIGHVERGLAAASLLPYDAASTLDRLLYLFHLATFAYLSGLFVRRVAERDGARRTLSRRVVMLVWLYLLWTLVQGVVRAAAASYVNSPVTFGDVARIWIPEGQLWFLPWLMAVTLITVTSQPWRSRLRAGALLVVATLVALVVWGYDPLYVFTRGWALLLPFVIGCVVTQARHAALARRLVPVVAAATLGAAVWLWVGLGTDAATPTTGGDVRTVTTVALGVLGCLAGTIAAVSTAAIVALLPVAGVVALIGRRSLEIFLAHIVVASGTRIALVQVGVTDLWVHLSLATLLGVVVPIGLAVLAERLGWTWVFGSPKRLEHLW